MTQFLKEDTAATIMFGPFVDKDDGVTLKTDATTITDIDHATTGIFLSKNGGTAAVRHQSVTASVADAYGMMKVTLDTTDTNTAGTLDVLFAKAATYLPVHKTFMVVNANVFDSLFAAAATDYLQVDALQLGGVTQSATDLKDLADTGYDPSTHKVQGVVLADTTTAVTNEVTADAVKISGDATAADDLELLVENAKGTDHKVLVSTDAQDLSASLDVNTKLIEAGDATDAINAACDAAIVTYKLDHLVAAAESDDPVDNSIIAKLAASDGDWSGFSAATDALEAIRDKETDIETDTGEIGTAGAGLTDLGGMSSGMKTEVESEANDALVAQKLDHLVAVADSDDVVNNAIIAKLASKAATADWSTFVNTTDSLEAHQDGAGTPPSAASIADAVWDEATSGHVAAGSFGKTDADILADTGELQTNQGNWATATGFATSAALSTHDGKLDTVDGVADAIKVVTDKVADTLEDDGGTYRFTENALEESPSGTIEGGDATGAKQDTIIAYLDTEIAAILVDTGTTLNDKLDTIDSNVDAILVDTGTTLDGKINTIDSIVDAMLVDTSSTLDGKLNTIDSNVDAILVDTGTTLDDKLDTIITDTATTLDNKLDTIDANVDAILVDTGTTLEGHLTDIETDTQDLQTQVGTAGAGLTDVGGFSTTAKGQINTEADTALTDYDPPTRAELTTDTNSIITQVNANETKIDTIDSNVDAILVDTGTTLDGNITAIKAKTDLRPSGVAKNVALTAFSFMMVDATDYKTPETGVSVTAQISKDGGAFANCTNSATEISSGWYEIDLTQAEMNADTIALKFTGTGCAATNVSIVTST